MLPVSWSQQHAACVALCKRLHQQVQHRFCRTDVELVYHERYYRFHIDILNMAHNDDRYRETDRGIGQHAEKGVGGEFVRQIGLS